MLPREFGGLGAGDELTLGVAPLCLRRSSGEATYSSSAGVGGQSRQRLAPAVWLPPQSSLESFLRAYGRSGGGSIRVDQLRRVGAPRGRGPQGVFVTGTPRALRRLDLVSDSEGTRGGDEWAWWVMTRCAACHQPKPLSDYYRDRTRKSGRERRCKPCSNSRRSERSRRRQVALEREGNRWVDRAEGCSICGAAHADSLGRRLHLDVDRKTSLVRGVLCSRCSSALGLLQNDLALLGQVAHYVASARKREPEPDWAQGRAVAAG